MCNNPNRQPLDRFPENRAPALILFSMVLPS
ncbi:MAG TPA: hypothetical protein DEQ44_05005 [Flavobacteriaceae bacterium]|nr:hypothetical protein [Flavobacteriaceae bacterium]